MSGQRGKAQELLNELKQLSSQRDVPAEDIAWVYTGLGDRDLAFVWWQKAYEERAPMMVHLQNDPDSMTFAPTRDSQNWYGGSACHRKVRGRGPSTAVVDQGDGSSSRHGNDRSQRSSSAEVFRR